jgi:glycosyltransferase involved in cell wall biosynthesis
MQALLDATVLQQPATGVAKVTLGLYESCFDLLPSMEVTAFHRRPLNCALAPQIRSVQYASHIPNYFWRSVALPMYILRHRPTFVHFPWNGHVANHISDTTTVTTILDVLPLIIPAYFKSRKDEREYRKRIQTDIDRSHLIMTISEYSKKEIIRNFAVKTEPLVVYPGSTIKVNSQWSKRNENEGDAYFLYVGGYDRRKGLEALLEVFIKLHRNGQLHSRLVLTAERKGYFSTEFRRLVTEGLRLGAVRETGYVSDIDLSRLYSRAIALVYPSKFEGFGLPPLEAMTLGCPVITTKCTSIPEICGDAAYYVDPDDETDFADALIALQNDFELGRVLGEKGKKRSARFSWHKSARIFLDAIMKFVANEEVNKAVF